MSGTWQDTRRRRKRKSRATICFETKPIDLDNGLDGGAEVYRAIRSHRHGLQAPKRLGQLQVVWMIETKAGSPLL